MCVLIILAEDVQRFGGVSRITTPPPQLRIRLALQGFGGIPVWSLPLLQVRAGITQLWKKLRTSLEKKMGTFITGLELNF